MEVGMKVALVAVLWAALTVLASFVVRRLDAARHPLAGTVRAARGLLLPLLLVLAIWRVADWPSEHYVPFQIVETALWMAGILVALSLATNTALVQREHGQYQTRFPKLFLDILRAILLVVGAVWVVSQVWDKDVGSLVAALGVTSIVLGLALQNTLDNVMAGIAVLFERPFEVGDWIDVGQTSGQVMEMNWRSVRVRTRSRDLIVVPNSVIGKETLINHSRPTRVHGEYRTLGFSYDDAPNKVKRILQQVALTTRGVLPDPPPKVRTVNYAAYAIEFQVLYFIDDYDRQQDINDEFMTRVWYAARRNGLTIPFPTQTSFEYKMPAPPAVAGTDHAEALAKVPVFVPLAPEEMAELSRDAVRQDYGRGERIVYQGETGDALYLILSGTAVVAIRDEHGGEREVARLSRGEFFGEMALLTGEPRTASVTAADDLAVLAIYKAALAGMLARRPALAQEMAEIVESRRQGLRAIQDMKSAPPQQREQIKSGASELVRRIRHFFGL
jgi:small-conductance mechanosensitive channel/CRP-like cAMP-binding protein